MIQIIQFFKENIQIIYDISLYFFLNHTFLKYVMVFHYIYIYIYINLIGFRLFGFCIQ